MTLKTIEKVNELIRERRGLEEFLRLDEKGNAKWVNIKYTSVDVWCGYHSDHTIELSQSGVDCLLKFVKNRIEEIDNELKELGVEEE